MDVRTARWLQVVRLSKEQLSELHNLEKTAGINWWIRGSYLLDRFNLGLGVYWSRSKVEVDRSLEVEQFEKRIYPLWASKYRLYQLGNLSEIDWIHAADLAIFAANLPLHTGMTPAVKADSSFTEAY